MRKQLIIALISALSATSVSAKAFTNFEEQVFRQNSSPMPLQLRELSEQEMRETEGEAFPLIGLGYLSSAGTFVATRYATPRIAASLLRRGAFQAAHVPRANHARNLAIQVHGRNNILRHGPSGHAYSPVNYSHYQAAKYNPNISSSRAHIFYGRRF